jgi:hypothetical protein
MRGEEGVGHDVQSLDETIVDTARRLLELERETGKA